MMTLSENASFLLVPSVKSRSFTLLSNELNCNDRNCVCCKIVRSIRSPLDHKHHCKILNRLAALVSVNFALIG
ncbi:hypothetical protein L596_017570 [Steinernema carpocapsae]|uniref:Uncharacterized protein n=1 Tax=Steinernema carpocapsae TaxID=34508 RepID=A0A4U5N2T3_STECR|nr:hypothetical protein L596_017570 [Steinernema carpocapsae]